MTIFDGSLENSCTDDFLETIKSHRDEELLARFSNGDRAAALALTSRLAPVVFHQAFRILNDRAEAEDVTQESLLRLWKAAPKWEANKAKSLLGSIV